MGLNLLVSGLSSNSFFTLTREIVEDVGGDYRVRVTPYFPRLDSTWIEYLVDLDNGDIDTVYILGMLNCMLDEYYLAYLVDEYGEVMLVPGRACRVKADKLQNLFKDRVGVIRSSGSYRGYMDRRTQFRLWMILSYLYVNDPGELERISREILTVELSLDSIIEKTIKKYYRRVNGIFNKLMHRLQPVEGSSSIDIRSAKYFAEKHLPLLPVLTRLLSLETGKVIITEYSQSKPYAYIALSIPRIHEGKGAGIIKPLLRNKKSIRRAVKASIAGSNMLEIMAEKEHVDTIVDELVKILELLGMTQLASTRSPKPLSEQTAILFQAF